LELGILDRLKEIIRGRCRGDEDFYILYLEAKRYIASVLDNMNLSVDDEEMKVRATEVQVGYVISFNPPRQAILHIDTEMNVHIYYMDIVEDPLGLRIITNPVVAEFLEKTLLSHTGIKFDFREDEIIFSLEECRKKNCSARSVVSILLSTIDQVVTLISDKIIREAATSLDTKIAATIISENL